MTAADWRYDIAQDLPPVAGHHRLPRYRGDRAAVGQRLSRHRRRGAQARPGRAGRGPAGRRVGGTGAGRAADGRAQAPGQGPAADRAVRAGRDDRVPAAAQRRRAGGARGHGQPARGDRAGLRQPAGRGVPGRAPGSAVVGRQRGRAGRHRADRGVARTRLRRLGADRAGRGGAPGGLPHRPEAAAGPVHRLRGHCLRHVGRDRVHPALDRVPAGRPAASRRGGHRLGRLPGPRAVGGRLRAVGARDGAAGRRAGHPRPLPGPGGRDPHLAGLARPGSRAGRAGRRGDRPGRRHPGQPPDLRRRGG